MELEDPERAAKDLERRLEVRGTPERAAGAKRYLKSETDHLGVSVGENRRLVRELVARRHNPDLSHDQLLALVTALWRRPVFDCRLAAALALESRTDLLTDRDLPLIERLIRESHTWALVDPIATQVLGTLAMDHPAAGATFDAWASDPDFWLRRAALLSQLRPLKAGAPFDRFAGYADAMLDEREFFIRKAIGWVLREYGKTNPDTVVAWLQPRISRASTITLREAVKYLPEDARGALHKQDASARPKLMTD